MDDKQIIPDTNTDAHVSAKTDGLRGAMERCFPATLWWEPYKEPLLDEFDALAARARMADQLEAALLKLLKDAGSEPLAVDISDYSDEFCSGFIQGQDHALNLLALARSSGRGVPDDAAVAYFNQLHDMDSARDTERKP